MRYVRRCSCFDVRVSLRPMDWQRGSAVGARKMGVKRVAGVVFSRTTISNPCAWEIGMKLRFISYASIISLIAWGCAAFGQSTQPADAVPKLPAPSGPFGIGRVGYDWVDP